MPSHPFLPAARVGKYEVLAHIATGGMGAVYKAKDRSLGRLVALKVLAERLVDNPASLERFRREARNAARLNHPNIVTLYEWGKEGDSHYMAMEFVDGPDLDHYILSKGRLDPDETRAILIQAVQALDHAYRQGIVHRDIKPSNFLLARQNDELLVKMTDLGLSRGIADDEYRVTRDGSTVGTVDYLSPEQSRDSRAADIRSDIYSLGCTAYHMLTGHPPFPDGGLGERVYKHLHAEPPDVRRINPDVPAGLWAVLKRMLAKAPADRYQTPSALLHDLIHYPDKPPEPPAPPPPARRPAERRESVASREQADEGSSDGADDEASSVSTPEQRSAAARQFERATEVLTSGDQDYARHLLLSCCELDPANLRYRRALRKIPRKPGGLLALMLAPLNQLVRKARLKIALQKQDYRKALQVGEEVLAGAPKDIGAHLDLSRAADALGLPRLALWLAEQARVQDPQNLAPIRALARLHESQGQFSQALKLWEVVTQKDSNDLEAQRKINDLAAQETIERGHYRRTGRGTRQRGKPPTDH